MRDQRQWRRGVGEEGSPWQLCVFLLVALVSQTSGDSQSGGNTHTVTLMLTLPARSKGGSQIRTARPTRTERGGEGEKEKKKVGIEWSQIVCVDPETKKIPKRKRKKQKGKDAS